ncbi:unnamed protein product, partial [marine sediment metagenome]
DLAWLYAFGKRISEIISLTRDDVSFNDDYIFARFTILKTRPKSGISTVKIKQLDRGHWLAPWLIAHISSVEQGYLFPSRAESGHLTRQGANWILQRYDDNVWCHLFRHSLAVQMAEHGANILELMAWFDWMDEKNAIIYVRTYGQAMEILSKKMGTRPF